MNQQLNISYTDSIDGGINQADYLRKIVAQDRSPIYTRVGEIMTNEVQLKFTFYTLFYLE